MSRVRIIVAQTEAGLQAAAGSFNIIASSKTQFSSCTTRYDAYFSEQVGEIGAIDIGEQGWIAIATR